jgi:hypothetical protein
MAGSVRWVVGVELNRGIDVSTESERDMSEVVWYRLDKVEMSMRFDCHCHSSSMLDLTT